MADMDYASNAKGNTAITLGSIGFGAGLLSLLRGNNGCCNNSCCNNGGLLGGLFGGNNCCCNGNQSASEIALAIAQEDRIAKLQADLAQSQAGQYSDKGDVAVYARSQADNKELRAEMFANVNPLINEVHNNAVNVARLQEQLKCCCEKQELREQILTGKINETALAINGKIDTMAANNNGMFSSLNQTIACISGNLTALTGRVNAITNEIVPLCKVCPQPMQRFNTFATPTAQAPDCGSCCAAPAAVAG